MVETETSLPGVTTRSQRSTFVTSKPSIITTTTTGPSTATKGIITESVETTASEATAENIAKTTLLTEVSTGPITSSTTSVLETTTMTPEIKTTSRESTIVSSQPSIETTSTERPSTTTKSSTTKSFEATTSKAPTVKTVTTKPPKEVTTGSKTTSTTTVVERTTSVPIIMTTGQKTAVVTSKPSLLTTTTQGPFSTTSKITTKSIERSTSPVITVNTGTTTAVNKVTTGPITKFTTAVEDTKTSKKSTVVTSKPSVSTTTATEHSPISTRTSSTTAVVETETSLPGVTTRSQRSTFVTSKPSVNTKTTHAPSKTTDKPTTGPVNTSITSVGQSTISVSGIMTPDRTTTVEISKPTFSSSTSKGPFPTTKRTTTNIESTTSVPFDRTHIVVSLGTTEEPSGDTTYISPITQTLPGSTAIYTASTTTQPTGTTVISSSNFTTTLTSCFCIVNRTSYHPGDLLYNVTDGLGWCFTAYCDESCNVKTQSSQCPTTPISSTTAHPTTPVVSTTTQATISSSVPFTTTVSAPISAKATTPATTTLDCNDMYPPRQNGESWKVSNCSKATCINGKISVAPVDCPPVHQPICSNGRKVVKMYDDDGCCFHYGCECVCSVWSGSHYMTFDGKSYSFSENCSHYLVREIISKYNLTIIKSHDHCDPSDSTFCPLALIVTYQSFKVVLTQLKTSGTATNVVYVNQKRIYPAYSNSVLLLTGTDMVITLVIQHINTKIVYRGSSFSIDLPYSLFAGNTEGQCGTCDNSKDNDCRSPNGQVESCSESAGQWHVPDTLCATPSTPPVVTTAPRTTPQSPPSTTQPYCKPSLCDLLSSSVFAPCHAVIAPGPFITSCAYDICYGGNNTCSSLEAYATECSNAGVCIDWRNATDGLCEHKCPINKVYMACGPMIEPTCNDRYNKKFHADGEAFAGYTKEGCFCPHGTTLFNTVYDTCVTSCGCVGPDGKPKQLGDTWTSECNTCVCDEDSMSINCQPVQCPAVQRPNCSEPGHQLVNKTNGCCTTPSCECSVNLCVGPITCPLGFHLTVTNGSCCQSYDCVPKGVCLYDMTEFKPGAKIPTAETPSVPQSATIRNKRSEATLGSSSEESAQPSPCQECYCGPRMDPITKLNIIACKPLVCNTSCSEGFGYQTATDKCCGTCVQKSCILTTPDNLTMHIIEVNDTFIPPNDKCVQYTCEKTNGQIVTKATKTICPPFNSLDCEPGTETTDAIGCCKTCKPLSVCEVHSKQMLIEVNRCISTELVNVTSCVGHCRSSSMYSAEANTMTHHCECCHEANTSLKQVELTCADGSKLHHSYTQVETCHCSKDDCAGGGTKPQRRRRR
ncbi:intestinal mucin-like protein isoform X2 [Leuresthes tenuis]|uniref:intestinal mucin-like protein isoform X2 n=1 Tax=Leuresthes tenuis TaxID=355514 RepID=UPI003B506307